MPIATRSRSRKRAEDAKLIAETVQIVKAKKSGALGEPVDQSKPAQMRKLGRSGENGSVIYRCRKSMFPVAVGLTLLGVAAFLRLVIRYSVHGREIQVGAGVVAVAAGTAVYVVKRRSVKRQQWRLGLACAFAAGWFTATVALGISYLGLAVLLGGGWVVSAHRLRVVRHPYPTEARKVTTDESVMQLWDRYVRTGLVKGATLVNPKTTDHTQMFTGRLGRDSKLHLGDVMQALPKIAVALGKPMRDLIVEDHPDFEDPAYFRFQVVTQSPIKEIVFYEGPEFEDGRIRMGRFADGNGWAGYKLTTRKRVWGGFALGSTGTGKTRLTEVVVLGARSTGAVVTFYLDGQNGASSAALMKYATWGAGQDDAGAMLAALEAIYRVRNVYNSIHGVSGFTPTPERPMLLVVVEECQDVFNDVNAERWGRLARAGGKVGIAILASSQYNSLEKTFGSDPGLRDSLYRGNKIVMKTESSMAKNMVPGLQMDPFDLPEIPGYGILVASKNTGGRTAPFRGDYLPDAEDKADDPSITVPTLENWLQRYPEAELEPEAIREAGTNFRDRHKRAEDRRAKGIAMLAGAADFSDDIEPDDQGDEPALLVDIPEALTGRPAAPASSPSHEAIVAAVLEGAWKHREIVERVDLGDRQVRTLLGQLVNANRLVKVGHGEYRAHAAELSAAFHPDNDELGD